MKRIDKLIKQAAHLAGSFVRLFFPGNDDGFIDALGVDPEKYKLVASDGTVGYDFMVALNDVAKECWSEEEYW